MVHAIDFIADVTARCFHHYFITLTLTNEGAGNRRAYRNSILFHVSLIFTHNTIRHLSVVIDIDEIDRRTKDNLTRVRNLSYIDHLSVGKFMFDFFNAPLGKTLLLTRGVIFRVFL